MFTALALMQVGRALSSRSFIESFWKQPLRTNKTLVGLILAVVALQLSVVYTPSVQTFFSAVGLSGVNLGLCIAFAMVVLAIMELVKAFARRNTTA
jgi:Ca2+-transporting ATPase